MVNCWFGARWFGFLESPYERDCYLRVPLEPQTTNPNQQITIKLPGCTQQKHQHHQLHLGVCHFLSFLVGQILCMVHFLKNIQIARILVVVFFSASLSLDERLDMLQENCNPNPPALRQFLKGFLAEIACWVGKGCNRGVFQ